MNYYISRGRNGASLEPILEPEEDHTEPEPYYALTDERSTVDVPKVRSGGEGEGSSLEFLD